MLTNDLVALQERAISLALEAGEAILSVYHSADFGTSAKEDHSPLTLADQQAHVIIAQGLLPTQLPLLSEEGLHTPFAERKQWDYFWLVDPLDGTKEFIKKNGEFTVNIALIHQQKPVLGVVYAPVLGKLYAALQGRGAFRQENKARFRLNKRENPPRPEVFKIFASRSHMNEATRAFIDRYPNFEEVHMGSSLKFMHIAEGQAHLYPRVAPTMEWDTAAAQVIVEETGGQVLHFETGQSLHYNKENLLNPHFVVYGHLHYQPL
ncbi:MAG: 3'(2'),5'-bisphosphate nucleotidase CysQ [Microscillaceae bacterium]